MVKAALGTLAVFVLSSIWLFFAWSQGNRTYDWTPVRAAVVSNNTDSTVTGRTKGFVSRVKYLVNGVSYEANVDEYLVGGEAEIFVDPENPRNVVGKQGPTMQAMFRPLIVTGATALFAVVLLLIAFSPKED